MNAIPILAPADLASIAVRQFLLIKHGHEAPDLTRDDRGIPRISTRCECCDAVSSSTINILARDEQHASTLTHLCHSMGLQGYLREARRMSMHLRRWHTLQEALEILGDSTARAELLAPSKH